MKKIDATVRRETGYIALGVLLFSVLMEAVFLIIRAWDYTVLLGNLLGSAAAIGNFFLMGLAVVRALDGDEAQKKSIMRFSQTSRFFMLILIAVIGWLVPCFHPVAVLVPLLFPRIAIAFRPLFMKKDDNE